MMLDAILVSLSSLNFIGSKSRSGMITKVNTTGKKMSSKFSDKREIKLKVGNIKLNK